MPRLDHENGRHRARLSVPHALPLLWVGRVDDQGELAGCLIASWPRERHGYYDTDQQTAAEAEQLASARARVLAAWRAGELPATAWVTPTSINATAWPSSAWLRRRLFDCPSLPLRAALVA